MGSSADLDRKIGKFQLIRILGQGGMGQVYLAKQANLDRHVAIKILHKELAEDDVFLERFQREARAAAVFQHPHIVAVIDADADEVTGEQYIAFEFVDGMSLEDRIKREGSLTEAVALEILRDVAEALAFAESKGIVHRDIKPDNILIANDGTVKLADLGLAKSFDRRDTAVTKTGVIVGTPLYMAPEQALGYETVDIRADLYSLGLVLWRLLTGLIPFDEDGDTSSLHILSRHINEDVPDVRSRNSEVSEATAGLIRSMCSRERDDRYRTAAALVQEIDRILDGEEPLGPKGSGDPNRTVDISQSQLQVGSKAATMVGSETTDSGRRRRRSDRSTIAWSPEEPEPRRGRAGKLIFVVVLLGAIVGGGFLAPNLLSGSSDAGTDVGEAPGDEDPGGSTNGGGDAASGGGNAATTGGGTVETVKPPPTSKVPPPDLTNEAQLVAHIELTSKLLFTKLDEGVDHLNAIKNAKGWADDPALQSFVGALDAILRMLDERLDADAHEEASRELRNIADAQRRKVVPGKLAATVDKQLEHWVRFSMGLQRLELALSDPRAQKTAIKLFEQLPEASTVEAQARMVIELTDTVDFYARWSTLAAKRVQVAKRRQLLVDKLAPTAIGAALRLEIRALSSLIRQLLNDPQRSLLSAIFVVGSTPDGQRSRFVKARQRPVPANASLRNMPARGLILELRGPWQKGQELAVTIGKNTFTFDAKGVKGREVRWGRNPLILLEPRSKDILVRLPEARPGEFSQRHKKKGRSSSRFTVNKKKLEFKRVLLIRLPPRGAS